MLWRMNDSKNFFPIKKGLFCNVYLNLYRAALDRQGQNSVGRFNKMGY